MTDYEMLEHMISMQADLDREIMKAHGLKGYEDISLTDLNLAILDEAGELTHELKPLWCWWKKPAKVDRDRVLEEFVDVVHFIMMRALKLEYSDSLLMGFTLAHKNPEPKTYPYAYPLLINSQLDAVRTARGDGYAIFNAVRQLGFTWAEVYEAYKAKNAVNHERVKEGY